MGIRLPKETFERGAIWSLLIVAILFGIASASSYIWVYNSNDLLKEKDEKGNNTTEKSIQILNIFSLVIIIWCLARCLCFLETGKKN